LEETILVDATNAFDVHRKAIADFGSKATSSEIVAELATLAHETATR
jgi:predicted dinucleotide-binding enzyme